MQRALSLAPVLVAACGSAPDFYAPAATKEGIVNGTRTPQSTCLADGEILSVVYLADPGGWEFCSGTLVHQRVVATAEHCTRGKSAASIMIGFGVNPRSPAALIQAAAIHEHSLHDFAVVVLDTPAAEHLPAILAIGMNRAAVDGSWIDRWVDAAGYGDTDNPTTSGRFFASVQIYGYDSAMVDVDGHGVRGICYGDSGGPILWQPAASLPPVLVGAESYGDVSCVDQDHLTRVDVVADWVDSIIAGLPAEPCGSVDSAGECQGDSASWCEVGFLRSQDCGPSWCGYVSPSYGYRCLPVACGGLDYYGECNGNILHWCTPCGLQTEDCSQIGSSCVWIDAATGYDCGDCPICNGACTDLATSMEHCGACNHACAIPNAIAECSRGRCAMVACANGYSDGDGEPSNGCEVALPQKRQYPNRRAQTDGGCACRAGRDGTLWGLVVLVGPVVRCRR